LKTNLDEITGEQRTLDDSFKEINGRGKKIPKGEYGISTGQGAENTNEQRSVRKEHDREDIGFSR